MKYAELSKKTPAELQKIEQDLKVELMKYRAQAATGAAGKDAGKIPDIKRTIARIKMILDKGGADKQ